MLCTDQDKALINDLINIAWAAGAVKSPQFAMKIEELRAKILAKPEAAAAEKQEAKGK